MSETQRVPSAASGLVRRLVQAARSSAARRNAAVGRCAAAVAIDPFGTVWERCPRRPFHDGGHDIESPADLRERLARATQIDPSRVLGAVEHVQAWLSGATGPAGEPVPPPLRALWLLIDSAEAAAHDRLASEDAAPIREVAADG